MPLWLTAEPNLWLGEKRRNTTLWSRRPVQGGGWPHITCCSSLWRTEKPSSSGLFLPRPIKKTPAILQIYVLCGPTAGAPTLSLYAPHNMYLHWALSPSDSKLFWWTKCNPGVTKTVQDSHCSISEKPVSNRSFENSCKQLWEFGSLVILQHTMYPSQADLLRKQCYLNKQGLLIKIKI